VGATPLNRVYERTPHKRTKNNNNISLKRKLRNHLLCIGYIGYTYLLSKHTRGPCKVGVSVTLSSRQKLENSNTHLQLLLIQTLPLKYFERFLN
jgi:hypothetical protein